MILRRNKSGSWKLRLRLGRDKGRVRVLKEIGLHTRSFKTALTCALAVLRTHLELQAIDKQGLRISDPEHNHVLSEEELEAMICALSHRQDKGVRVVSHHKRRRSCPQDGRQLFFDF